MTRTGMGSKELTACTPRQLDLKVKHSQFVRVLLDLRGLNFIFNLKSTCQLAKDDDFFNGLIDLRGRLLQYPRTID